MVGLTVEQRFFARSRAARRGEAIAWSLGWLALALVFAGGIAIAGGPVGAWTTVYLIERSLSLDNVFLFSLLLTYFVAPPELRDRVIAAQLGHADGGVTALRWYVRPKLHAAPIAADAMIRRATAGNTRATHQPNLTETASG